MLRSALRDLQWRRRRFAIATIATALVFGMTLVLTGLSNGFNTEASQTISQLHADGWIVADGASGPFLGAAPMAAATARGVTAISGVVRAAPTVFTRKAIIAGPVTEDVNVFGAPAGGPGMPTTVSSGRPPAHPGEIAVSTKLRRYRIGDHLVLAGQTFVVVGRIAHSTALAGVPNVFLTLPDAQRVAFAGQPVASAVAFEGPVPTPLPPGLFAVTNATARSDLLRALKQAGSAIALMAALLWVVAAMIVGSMVYLSAIERQRDFAVFKATGVATASILGGLAFQAVVISLVAALIGSIIASVLGPNFPLQVSITRNAQLLLPVIAILVGLLASASGLRRVVTIDPALAFGGP